nr:fibronectin type III domain-containing protein [Butyrivibrio sp. WCE2006]
MKKVWGIFGGLLFILFFVCIPCNAMVSKALSGYVKFSNVTSKSITVDLVSSTSSIRSSDPGAEFTKYALWLRILDRKTDHDSLVKKVDVDGGATSYTFTGLSSGRTYQVELHSSFRNGSSGGESVCFGEVETKRSNVGYPIKLSGVTDSTIAISYDEAIKQLIKDCKDRNWTNIQPFEKTPYMGIAAESKTVNTSKALKNALGKALEAEQSYNKNNEYVFKKLKPKTTYAICMVVPFYYTNEYGLDKVGDEYFELTGVTTDSSGAYTGDDVGDTSTKSYINNKFDPTTKGIEVTSDNFSTSKYANFSVSTTETSITLDWSKYQDVTTAGSSGKFYAVCVEDKAYDVFKDIDKYGYNYNWGPNMRSAINQAKKSPSKNAISKGKTSYTIKNLKKGTRYCLVFKCGCKNEKYKHKTVYVVNKVYTTGASKENIKHTYDKITKGYMFDYSVKREGKTFLLDWADARSKYMNQSIFKEYPMRQSMSYVTVKYEEIPANATNKEVEQIYIKLDNHYGDNYFIVDVPATRTRIYNLDVKKKYVFRLEINYEIAKDGETYLNNDYFYYDDTGENYHRKKALGHLTPDPKPVDDTPGSNPGDNTPGPTPGDNTPGPTTGDNTSGSNPGDNTPGPTTGDNTSGSNPGENTPGPSAGDNTPHPKSGDDEGAFNPGGTNPGVSAPGSDASKDEKMVLVGKKLDQKAHIYVSDSKLKASKLKHSKKNVTIKIENSKGKITVKNSSKEKLKDYVKLKIKGRQINATFKKGAPKGIYKFKVTVNAKDGIKKTVQTVKIKVK